MRLHRSQLPQLAKQIVKALVEGNDIETDHAREVEHDVESVLATYVGQVDQAVARARDIVQERGLPQGEFARFKKLAAEQAGIKIGDDALDYLLEQLVQMLMHSGNVEEVYAEDHTLKRRMRPFLREHLETDDNIDAEVRTQLKHVKEGSRVWEIEYERMKAEIRRRRGL
jgi:hypothetical protein